MTRNTVQLERTDSPTRMTTRAKNATAHPGAILQDTQRARRSKEEINQEKELKNIQKEAKAQKKAAIAAKKVRGEAYIAQLEDAEDATIANVDRAFPRHKLKKSL
jgi:hypothetical protein